MTRLDPRLREARLPLYVLAEVFADHFRGVPAAMTCTWCGHRFPADDSGSDCPTNTVVRELLYRRWRRNYALLAKLLSPKAFENLCWVKPQPRPLPVNNSTRNPETGGLFDSTPYRRYGGTR